MTIPPKKVNNSDPGDADHVGGNDWDDISDYLNNIDKTGPAVINTETRFRSSKKKLMNPANTFGYTEVSSAITADRNVTEPLLTGNDTRVYQSHTQTLSNKTLDSTCTLPAVFPTGQYTYTLYRSGTNIKARNNITGLIDYSGDATDDAVPTINSALANIQNVGSGLDDNFGGGINILHGVYKCKTTIDMTRSSMGRNGATIAGEGWGTFLDFVPTTTLARGIQTKMAHPTIKDLRIKGNSNTTALIEINGDVNLQPRSNSNLFQNLLLEGPNGDGDLRLSGDTFTPISGQIGLYFNAFVGATNQFMFYSTVDNCKWISLDYAIRSSGVDATSISCSNIASYNCTTFWLMENNSGAHELVNGWIEGSLYARYGVVMSSGTGIVAMANIWSELHLAATECALIKVSSGASGQYVHVTNCRNLDEDFATWFTVLDENSPSLVHWQDNYVSNRSNTQLWNYDGSQITTTRRNVIQLNNDLPFKVFKPLNTTNSVTGISLDQYDSDSVQKPYGQIFSRIITNTAGAEDGEILLKTVKAGSMNEVLRVTKDGVLQCGGTSRRVMFADTNLTSQRTFTYANTDSVIPGLITKSNTANDINTTNAEQNMLSYSVAGNALGANGSVRFTITGYLLQNQATGTTYTFKVKFGTTVMWQDVSPSVAQSATKLPFRIEGELFNKNATNAQACSGRIIVNDTGAATTGIGDIGDDTMLFSGIIDSEGADTTKDTTSSQTLAVTVTMSVSDAAVHTVVKHYTVELFTSA